MSEAPRIRPSTNLERGFMAGMLVFLLGPPLGGIIYGLIGDLIIIAQTVRIIAPGASPPMTFGQTLAGMVLLPMFAALFSFVFAWSSAAIAAIYVAARVGMTGKMSWGETVILGIICAMLLPGLHGRQYWEWTHGGWQGVFIALPNSLFPALALRWLAGRLTLVG